jgi:hypothetical protein
MARCHRAKPLVSADTSAQHPAANASRGRALLLLFRVFFRIGRWIRSTNRLVQPDRLAPIPADAAPVPMADYSHAFIGWRRQLSAPYPIAGNEPWLEGIHWIRKQMRR